MHLDQEYWLPYWVEPSPQDWEEKVKKLIAEPSWILDGNYGGTMDLRIARADTVVYLNFPSWKSLLRVLWRMIRSYGKSRPDMPAGCTERFDRKFLAYVAAYNKTRHPGIMARLAKAPASTTVYVWKNDREIRQFLDQLSGSRK